MLWYWGYNRDVYLGIASVPEGVEAATPRCDVTWGNSERGDWKSNKQANGIKAFTTWAKSWLTYQHMWAPQLPGRPARPMPPRHQQRTDGILTWSGSPEHTSAVHTREAMQTHLKQSREQPSCYPLPREALWCSDTGSEPLFGTRHTSSCVY